MKPELAARDSWQLLKEDGRIAVYRAATLDGLALVIKEYRFEHWLDQLRFRRKQQRVGRLYRCDALAGMLSSLVFSQRAADRGQFGYAFLVGNDWRKLDWQSLPAENTSALMEQAARLVKRLHDEGWVHGDFKFGNLLSSAEGKLYLLDVEGVRPARSDQRRARDLARFLLNAMELNLAASDLEHFWQSYCRQSSGNEALAQAVYKWLQVFARRHGRKYQRESDLRRFAFLFRNAAP